MGFIVGFILGIVITGILAKMYGVKMMIKEIKSPYDFDKTVNEIIKRAKELGWNVPAIHDFGGKIREAGMDVGKVKVIEICKPEYGAQMLKNDEEKLVSAFLPCGMGVYEKKDGSVYVAKRNVELFALMFGKNVGKALKEAAKEENRITAFLK